MTKRLPILSLVVAAAALISGATILPTASPAAPGPLTGVYAADISGSPLVLRVYQGRVSSVTGSLRPPCGGGSPRKVTQVYKIGRGPAVDAKGRVRIAAGGVTVTGVISGGAARGTVSAPSCDTASAWSASARRL